MTKLIFLAVGLMLIFTACTSTTVLKASSPHAKIYADGKFLGEGQVVYSDKKIAGSKTVVEVKRAGFKDEIATISRSGSINAGALVGGILLAPTFFGLLFFLWVTDYDNYYAFEQTPLANSSQTVSKK